MSLGYTNDKLPNDQPTSKTLTINPMRKQQKEKGMTKGEKKGRRNGR
jgi:uncharacterized protein YnzC (UPF0291/DUF896 family)